MIFAVGNAGNTILHGVSRSEQFRRKCRPEFIAKLWRLNPAALRALNTDKETPFHIVVSSENDALFDLFQWSLSLDEIVSACEAHWMSYERLRPVMEVQCETLLTLLNQDVLGTVFEYLGFKLRKRPAKLMAPCM